MYDPITQKCIISKDVRFNEQQSWNWGRSSEAESDTLIIDEDGVEETHEDDTSIQHTDSGEDNSSSPSPSSPPSEDSPEENDETQNQPAREKRSRFPSTYLRDYASGEGLSEEEDDAQHFAMFTCSTDPTNYADAIKEKKWREAMDVEIESIERNGTWELVDLPTGVKKIGVKWVYKTKLNEKGEVDKCKARLVAKGYAQQYGVDYEEVFAPVARWDTIRMLLAVAAHKGWCVFQLDVKSAFLHGVLKETVYVEQPEGYIREGEEHKAYKLQKALYGLKQAPRAWYSKIEDYFAKEGFNKCSHEHTLFTKKTVEGKLLVVSLYVDDLIFTGNDPGLCENFKSYMKQNFDMTDLGKMSYFLGVEVKQSVEGIFVCQKKYAMEIVARFGMEDCNPVNNPIVPGTKLSKEEGGEMVDSSLYKQLIGCLMYLTASRPDIMFSVCFLSKFMTCPREAHLTAAKRVLRYVKGSLKLGLFYKRNEIDNLKGYTDSDFAGDMDGSKSTSGYAFLLSGAAVAWSSRKQPIVTLSTTEAEYVAASACACQSVWMKEVLSNFHETQNKVVSIYCDNSSSIKLSKNPVFHGRTKHIKVRFHFIRDLVKDGEIELVFCGTQEQIADIMTKPLKLDVFLKLRNMLGIRHCEDAN